MQLPPDNLKDPNGALEAPVELVEALKALPQERITIPPTVDRAILQAAEEQFVELRQQRATGAAPRNSPALDWLRSLLCPGSGALRWAAAAAVIVLLASIPRFTKQAPPAGAGQKAAFARGDVNQDNRIDVLDAFALARQIKQGQVHDLRLDLNDDKAVDERDAAILAARAVKLEPGGRS